MNHISQPSSAALLLRLTLRLRFMAAAGQLISLAMAAYVFKLDLQWWGVITGLIFTVLSNHHFHSNRYENAERCQSVTKKIIFCDTLVLTLMLYFTGGVYNPFIGFYLLHITLAAMTLTGKSLGGLIMIIATEVIFLAYFYHPFNGPSWVSMDGRLTYSVFLAGWSVSLILIAGWIAFFVHWINSQLRDREKALRDAEHQITATSRYQSLATLAAGVAHELGTPLGTIAIVSKDLERSLRQKGATLEWQEDSSLIRSEVERCRQILDRLDRNVTGQTGESVDTSTASLICEQLEKQLPTDVLARLKINDRTDAYPLILSTQAVLQSLIVLIENACEADVAGDSVTLDIRIEEKRNIVFRVQDTGPGIPNALRNKIGDPFFTTKKDRSRKGLGLFLVKTLTDHLGGTCNLQASVNGGTCAILTLPVKPSQQL